MKKIIKNKSIEFIEHDNSIIFISDTDNIYILQEIERAIWDSFDESLTVDEAYLIFLKSNFNMQIDYNDFNNFIMELILNNILQYDKNSIT